MICEQCTDTFEVYPMRSKGPRKAKYCSVKCRGEANSKLPHTIFNGVLFYKNISRGYYQDRKGVQLHRVKWEHYRGPIPKGHVIHHKDGDGFNNSMKNLEAVEWGEHTGNHNRLHYVCTKDGCNGKHVAKGYCNKHYLENKAHRKLKE